MKKKVLLGQPLYMGQFTSLMIIILAFFILLQSMSSTQEAGFQKGIGKVKNAFGLTGGMGLFDFITPGAGGSSVPNPSGTGDKNQQGIHENLVRGEGGTGNTSSEVNDFRKGKFLQVDVPVEFPKFKAYLTTDTKNQLDKFKVGLILYDYKLSIKCYCNEYTDKAKNNYLALQRAANIMRYIHETANIPYSRLEALGNSSRKYYSEEKKNKMADQETFFYIFEKNSRRK